MNMNRVVALPTPPSRGFWRRIASEMQLLFGRPPRVQFAALCFRPAAAGHGHEILLITSRDTGRWVTPKGWPMKGRTGPEVAGREARQEAGVFGTVGEEPIGRFSYYKTMQAGLRIRCVVQVYPLRYEGSARKYREKGQRQLAWLPPEEAAARVQEPGLKAIIRAFNP